MPPVIAVKFVGIALRRDWNFGGGGLVRAGVGLDAGGRADNIPAFVWRGDTELLDGDAGDVPATVLGVCRVAGGCAVAGVVDGSEKIP